jgi:hypothetical protein
MEVFVGKLCLMEKKKTEAQKYFKVKTSEFYELVVAIIIHRTADVNLSYIVLDIKSYPFLKL